MYQCKRCNNSNYSKSGFVKGEQRYRCRLCGCQFVPTREHGMGLKKKALALCLYVNGLSFRAIGKIIKVDHAAVYRFVRKYAEANYEKPEPVDGVTVMLELDEMWHYISDKKTNSGYGRLIVAIPINLSTGNVEGETLVHLSDFLSD